MDHNVQEMKNMGSNSMDQIKNNGYTTAKTEGSGLGWSYWYSVDGPELCLILYYYF